VPHYFSQHLPSAYCGVSSKGVRMVKIYKLFILFFLMSCSSASEEDLTSVFGLSIGKPISEKYLDSKTAEYPTRIITLKVNSSDELKIFKSFMVQIIESDKTIYSIVAEKEYNSSATCNFAFQDLYKLLNEKYEHLKQTREINIDGDVISADDGYKSMNGKNYLRFGCSVDENGINKLDLSVWNTELQSKVDKLWSKFTANKKINKD
jgi:hypothetical protein